MNALRGSVPLCLLLVACGAMVEETPSVETCTATADAGTVVVIDDQTLIEPSASVLVCDGGSAVVNGSSSQVFLMAGASATINGTSSRVVADAGSNVVINATSVELQAHEDASTQLNTTLASHTLCESVVVDVSALDDGCP